MNNYKAQMVKHFTFALSLRGTVYFCHCEECSDEAISVGTMRSP